MGMRSLLAILLLAVGAVASAHPPRIATFDQLMSALGSVKEARSTFVETRHIQQLKTPLTVHGDLYYHAPATLREHIDGEQETWYEIHGDVMRMKRGGEGMREFELRQYPLLWAYIESIRATLSGDARTLRRFYTIESTAERHHWHLVLKPRERSIAAKVQSIGISGSATRVARIIVVESTGDTSSMALRPMAAH